MNIRCLLLLFLLYSCTPKPIVCPQWDETSIDLGCGQKLTKWTTTASSEFAGFQLEYSEESSLFYINTFSTPLNKGITVTLQTSGELWEDEAILLEGDQRMLLSPLSQARLIRALCEGKEIEISFGRFYEKITPQGFLQPEKKALHSVVSEWLQNSCPGN